MLPAQVYIALSQYCSLPLPSKAAVLVTVLPVFVLKHNRLFFHFYYIKHNCLVYFFFFFFVSSLIKTAIMWKQTKKAHM